MSHRAPHTDPATDSATTPARLSLPAALMLAGLLLAGAVHAQTLIDTAAAATISTRLDATQTQPGGALSPKTILDKARDAASLLKGALSPPEPAAPGSAGVPSLPPRPLPTPELKAALAVASAELQAGNTVSARARYERIVAANYDQPSAHFGLGVALASSGDTAGATFEFKETLRLDPQASPAAFNLGVLARSRAGVAASPEAAALFSQALTLARGHSRPETLRPLIEALAAEQRRSADTAGLQASLTELNGLFPDEQAVTLRLARVLASSQTGAPQALTLLYPLRQADPGNVDAALLTAAIYHASGLLSRAERELSVAIPATRAGADRARLLLALAFEQAAQGNLNEAVKSAAQARLQNPQSAEAAAALGRYSSRAGNNAAALSALRVAASIDRRNAALQADLASTELRNGHAGNAARAARASLAGNGTKDTQARASLTLGMARLTLGNAAGARAPLRSATLQDPLSAQAWLYLGTAEYQLRDYAGASAAFTQSLNLAPGGDARTRLGTALLAGRRPAEAEQVFKAQLNAAPTSGDTWYLLGLARRALGQEAGARTAFKSAVQLGDARASTALKLR